MRTPEELRTAIRHMTQAQHGAAQSGDVVKEGLCSRMVDLLHWVLREPAAFDEWMRRFEEYDKIGSVTKLRGM